MQVPQVIPNPEHQVCRLRKSLYGLKQASRQWFQKLSKTLVDLGYQQSKCDYSLFINKSSRHITVVAIYVDDILVTGSDSSKIQHVKTRLDSLFGIKDLGRLNYFLGLEVVYLDDGIFLSQRKFTQELLVHSGFVDCTPAVTPLPLNCKLVPTEGTLLSDPTVYRTLIGKLNFLTHTRLDLSFTVQTLSQFMQSPRDSHLQALHHTLRYVKGTTDHGIVLKGSDQLRIQAYSDSDWAACLSTRRSVSGYVVLLGSSPINWRSKKQGTVSRSSSEAEYRAMAQTASEVTWLVKLFGDLGVHSLKPVPLTITISQPFPLQKIQCFMSERNTSKFIVISPEKRS